MYRVQVVGAGPPLLCRCCWRRHRGHHLYGRGSDTTLRLRCRRGRSILFQDLSGLKNVVSQTAYTYTLLQWSH